MNRKYITVCSIAAILLSSTPAEAKADIEKTWYTQTINTKRPLKLLDGVQTFRRIDAEIITIRPWLNKENQVKKLSLNEVKAILREAGFSGGALKLATRIVFLESTNRPYAYNKFSNCYGLFQINMSGAMGTDRRSKYNLSRNEDLFDPLTNAKVAYHMSDGGKDWSAWTTYPAAKN